MNLMLLEKVTACPQVFGALWSVGERASEEITCGLHFVPLMAIFALSGGMGLVRRNGGESGVGRWVAWVGQCGTEGRGSGTWVPGSCGGFVAVPPGFPLWFQPLRGPFSLCSGHSCSVRLQSPWGRGCSQQSSARSQGVPASLRNCWWGSRRLEGSVSSPS